MGEMAESNSDDQFRVIQNEIRESIRRNHPNPGRLDCIGSSTLRKIAEGDLPPSHPGYKHVMECSPCYEELMILTEQVEARRVATRVARRRHLSIAVSTAVLLFLIALLFLLPRLENGDRRVSNKTVKNQPTSPVIGQTPIQDRVVAMLNLDSEPSLRGGDGKIQTGASQRLPRRRLDLTINLPRGMEEGLYNLQISKTATQPVLFTSGQARIENGLTVLRLQVDLTHFTPGMYHLKIGRPGMAWRESDIFLF